MKKVTEEIGDKTPNEDLQRLIKNGASNDTDILYEEFHSIMTKEVSLKLRTEPWSEIILEKPLEPKSIEAELH